MSFILCTVQRSFLSSRNINQKPIVENCMINLFKSNPSDEVSPLQVHCYGDPVLRERSVPVESVTPEIRELAERMIVTMFQEETRGIGLAAPQIGRTIRLITLATEAEPYIPPPDASPGERMLGPQMPIALVNPEILSFSSVQATATEGCLSIPEIFGNVTRPANVRLRAMTLDGRALDIECGGMLARCLQHEIDHLDGTLFVDRWTNESAEPMLPKLEALEKRVRRKLKKRRPRV